MLYLLHDPLVAGLPVVSLVDYGRDQPRGYCKRKDGRMDEEGENEIRREKEREAGESRRQRSVPFLYAAERSYTGFSEIVCWLLRSG